MAEEIATPPYRHQQKLTGFPLTVSSRKTRRRVHVGLVHFVVFLAYSTEGQNAEPFEIGLKGCLGLVRHRCARSSGRSFFSEHAKQNKEDI